MTAKLQEELTPQEFNLYQQIQTKYICDHYEVNPKMQLDDMVSNVYRLFLSQKWICNVEPSQISIPENEYQKMALTDGPDLTRIPRYRYKVDQPEKNQKGQKKTSINAYACYFQEQVKLLTGIEHSEKMKVIGQKWKNLTPEEKEPYRLKAQEFQ